MIDNLASPKYRVTLAQMHEENESWGNSRPQWVDIVRKQIDRCEPRNVLDYGAGKGWMARAIRKDTGLPVAEYDPGVPSKAILPETADFVICNDVLEHVETQCVGTVIDHLYHITRCACFVNIVLREARKQVLPDGRNPHLTVMPREWWIERLARRFDIQEVKARGKPEHEFTAILYPKAQPPILIAGPPRSGSSFLAGLLSRYGAWTGESVPADSGNPKGYYENAELVHINKRILKVNGQSGKCEPPALESPKVPFDFRAVVAKYAPKTGPWVFKDGKIVRTWRAWAAAYPDAIWVLPSRAMSRIVRSMGRHPVWSRRGDLAYCRRCAEAMAEEQSRIVGGVRHSILISADSMIAERDEEKAAELARFCGLKYDPQALSKWADPEAYHV